MSYFNVLKKIRLFFSTKKILLVFLPLTLLLAIVILFYKEKQITIKQAELLNFNLEKAPKPKEKCTYDDYLLLDKISANCSPYNIEDSYLGWYWQESDDISLVKTWYHFKTSMAKIGMSNVDPIKYKNRVEWFQRFVLMRKFCLPHYFKIEKSRGYIHEAMGYGLIKGFVSNFSFFDKKNIDAGVERYFLPNVYYLYSRENRLINFSTSWFFSLGLLAPWYLLASLFLKGRL